MHFSPLGIMYFSVELESCFGKISLIRIKPILSKNVFWAIHTIELAIDRSHLNNFLMQTKIDQYFQKKKK